MCKGQPALSFFLNGRRGRLLLYNCTQMEAEWYPAKAPSVRDECGDEERWISIGVDSLGHILVVVYTWRDERVRLISARPATRGEVRQYEKGI